MPRSSAQAHTELVPLGRVKVFYFASFCYFATYYRYLTLYFESDGFSASQIGLLMSVSRVLGIVFTPLINATADKTKRARGICQVSSLIAAVPLLLLSIPGATFAGRAAAFWTFSLLSSPQGSLRDALAIAACGQDVERWGKARVYGAVGWGLMHLLLGPLVDALGFSALFASQLLLAAFLFLATRRGVPQACGKVQQDVSMRDIAKLFCRNKIFFVNVTVVGAGFAMVEGMLFLLLQEMGASTLLCGLSVVVTVVFELPIFTYAKPILERLGVRRMILLGQVAWVIRAAFYANLYSAWAVLLIEPLHGVTFALVWTATTQHVANPAISGQGMEASAQGLLSVCFGGVGPILGLAGGGYLFDTVGSHAAYAIFAVVVMLSAAMYAAFEKDPDPSLEAFSDEDDDLDKDLPAASPAPVVLGNSDEPELPQKRHANPEGL